jgi:hypothetical protein
MNDLGTLRRQQQALAQAVRSGRPPPRRLLQATPLGHHARIDAYQHAYRARLAGALRDNFEVLALAMGDEAFAALAQAYTEAHPSRQPSIRWFGHRLVDFVASQVDQDDGLVPHPAMVDMARLDWALRDAFDATDAQVLDASALAALPADAWPRLRFALHPSVQRLSLAWAIGPAWHALRAHADAATDTSDGSGEPELPSPEPLAHTVLVWRRGLSTQWRSLDATEAALLAAVASGRPFARWCELAGTLLDDPHAAVPLVVGRLQQWLAEGLLSSVR